MASALPPSAPILYPFPVTLGLLPIAPTINLSLRSGVFVISGLNGEVDGKSVPLHSCHPTGVVVPDHIIIPPTGKSAVLKLVLSDDIVQGAISSPVIVKLLIPAPVTALFPIN